MSSLAGVIGTLGASSETVSRGASTGDATTTLHSTWIQAGTNYTQHASRPRCDDRALTVRRRSSLEQR